MYLELTGDPYWQGLALEAIYSWYVPSAFSRRPGLASRSISNLHRHLDETARVEDVLLEEKSTATLLACFANAKNAAFESILDVSFSSRPAFHELI